MEAPPITFLIMTRLLLCLIVLMCTASATTAQPSSASTAAQVGARERAFIEALTESRLGNADEARTLLIGLLDGARAPAQQAALYDAVADVYERDGALGEAVYAAEQAAAHLPTAERWYRLATLHIQRGNAPAGQEALTQALQLNPAHLLARLELGRLLTERGDAESAVSLLKEAAERHPRTEAVHVALARAHRATGDDAAARRTLTTFLGHVPVAPDARSLLGALPSVQALSSNASPSSVMQEHGAPYSEAYADHLLEAVATNPRDRGLWAEALTILARSADAPRSDQLAEDARLLFPGDPVLAIPTAEALLTARKPEEALATLDESAAVPDSVRGEALTLRVRALTALGRLGEAEASLDAARSSNPPPAALAHAEGDLAHAQGDAPAAAAAWRRALDLDPGRRSVSRHLSN